MTTRYFNKIGVAIVAALLCFEPPSALAGTALNNPPSTGSGSYVISTGLTNTLGTLTADLSTGKSGGQTAFGGTATTESLTLRPNAADATTGKIQFFGPAGTTTAYFDNGGTSITNMPRLAIGTAAFASGAIMLQTTVTANSAVIGYYATNPNAGAATAISYQMSNGTATDVFQLHGNSFTTAGNVTAGTLMIRHVGGTGNVLSRLEQNTGDFIWETTTSNTERMRLTTAGEFLVGAAAVPTGSIPWFFTKAGGNAVIGLALTNSSAGTAAGASFSIGADTASFPCASGAPCTILTQYSNSFTTSGNRTASSFEVRHAAASTANLIFHSDAGSFIFSGATQASPVTLLKVSYKNVASIASGASATLDVFSYPATTVTITGGTNITTAAGFNYASLARPTYTDGSAVTITNAATWTVLGCPTAAGSVTITNCYAEWVQQGISRFDGDLNLTSTMTLGSGTLAANNTVATVLGSLGPTSSHTTVQEWMLVKGTGGANRWIPMF